MAVEVLRRRFTVEEYHRMGEAGILQEDDRVELIDGEIVEMTPIGSRHAACVKRLVHLFAGALGDRAVVSVQDPIAIPPESETQPDVALLRPRADFYAGGHPQAADVWLVVEVADASLPVDRGVKLPLYARAGLREAWLVDLAGEVVEVFRRPGAGGYADVQRRARGDRLGCEAFPDVVLTVDDVLGPRS
jgi:Uma2 family endonuclease